MVSPSPELDELASALVKARAALGISQNELHKRTGISREAIKGYESGRNKPGAREIRLLCVTLQVTPNTLLFGTESPFESKGDLYDLMHATGQLDWAKFAVLFGLLTAKEKASIMFIVESILLGRNTQEAIAKALRPAEAMSAIVAAMMSNTVKVQEGLIDNIAEGLAEQVDEFMEHRDKENNKKPE